MKRLVLPLFSLVLTLGFSAPIPFDQLLNNAKQQILFSDYFNAAFSLVQARKSIAGLGTVRQDYAALNLNAQSANTDMVLSAIADALAKHSSNDLDGTTKALDLAVVAISALDARQTPTQRYVSSKAALQRATSAKISGTT